MNTDIEKIIKELTEAVSYIDDVIALLRKQQEIVRCKDRERVDT